MARRRASLLVRATDDDEDSEEDVPFPRRVSHKIKPRRKAHERPQGPDQVRQAFSKRKKGLVLKAYQLHALTDAKVMLYMVNAAGASWAYATPGFGAALSPELLRELRMLAAVPDHARHTTEVMADPCSARVAPVPDGQAERSGGAAAGAKQHNAASGTVEDAAASAAAAHTTRSMTGSLPGCAHAGSLDARAPSEPLQGSAGLQPQWQGLPPALGQVPGDGEEPAAVAAEPCGCWALPVGSSAAPDLGVVDGAVGNDGAVRRVLGGQTWLPLPQQAAPWLGLMPEQLQPTEPGEPAAWAVQPAAAWAALSAYGAPLCAWGMPQGACPPLSAPGPAGCDAGDAAALPAMKQEAPVMGPLPLASTCALGAAPAPGITLQLDVGPGTSPEMGPSQALIGTAAAAGPLPGSFEALLRDLPPVRVPPTEPAGCDADAQAAGAEACTLPCSSSACSTYGASPSCAAPAAHAVTVAATPASGGAQPHHALRGRDGGSSGPGSPTAALSSQLCSLLAVGSPLHPSVSGNARSAPPGQLAAAGAAQLSSSWPGAASLGGGGGSGGGALRTPPCSWPASPGPGAVPRHDQGAYMPRTDDLVCDPLMDMLLDQALAGAAPSGSAVQPPRPCRPLQQQSIMQATLAAPLRASPAPSRADAGGASLTALSSLLMSRIPLPPKSEVDKPAWAEQARRVLATLHLQPAQREALRALLDQQLAGTTAAAAAAAAACSGATGSSPCSPAAPAASSGGTQTALAATPSAATHAQNTPPPPTTAQAGRQRHGPSRLSCTTSSQASEGEAPPLSDAWAPARWPWAGRDAGVPEAATARAEAIPSSSGDMAAAPAAVHTWSQAATGCASGAVLPRPSCGGGEVPPCSGTPASPRAAGLEGTLSQPHSGCSSPLKRGQPSGSSLAAVLAAPEDDAGSPLKRACHELPEPPSFATLMQVELGGEDDAVAWAASTGLRGSCASFMRLGSLARLGSGGSPNCPAHALCAGGGAAAPAASVLHCGAALNEAGCKAGRSAAPDMGAPGMVQGRSQSALQAGAAGSW